MKDRWALAVFCALALLCVGAFLGRMSALHGGAVLRAEDGPVSALPALSVEAAPQRGTGARLNINTATAAQLCELPGIGPALAQRIVDYRTENGEFESTAELEAVEGIGTAIRSAVEELVTVTD